jgi:hypothetical protein
MAPCARARPRDNQTMDDKVSCTPRDPEAEIGPAEEERITEMLADALDYVLECKMKRESQGL